MKIKVYKTIDKNLINEWLELWKKSPFANYTNSPHWFLSVHETFKNSNFVIIAIFQNNKLVSVGALWREKKYGVTIYTVSPGDFVSGMPFLIDIENELITEAFIQQLSKLDIVYLSNIPEDFISLLKIYTQNFDAIYQSVNYYLPITKEQNGLVKLNKRNKLIHQIKNNSEKFTIHKHDGTTLKYLDKVFLLDELSSKQGKGYNTFDTKIIKEFYKILAKNFNKQFLVNILYFNKNPIAYEIGFFIGNSYFGSQTAYNLEYKQFSPGKVIFVKVVDYLASKDITMWDMGSGESSVKQLVTEKKRTLYQVVLSQNKSIRLFYITIDKLKIFSYEKSKKYKKIYLIYRTIKKIFQQ